MAPGIPAARSTNLILEELLDRKSTRLNSSHSQISYAVFCLIKKTNLSKPQQLCVILRQMLTQAPTTGQYLTSDQISKMTREVRAEVYLVYPQKPNQRYGSSQ